MFGYSVYNTVYSVLSGGMICIISFSVNISHFILTVINIRYRGLAEDKTVECDMSGHTNINDSEKRQFSPEAKLSDPICSS